MDNLVSPLEKIQRLVLLCPLKFCELVISLRFNSFLKSEILTLPARFPALSFHIFSVVDISDIYPGDAGPAQLHPGVHHHLLVEVVL